MPSKGNTLVSLRGLKSDEKLSEAPAARRTVRNSSPQKYLVPTRPVRLRTVYMQQREICQGFGRRVSVGFGKVWSTDWIDGFVEKKLGVLVGPRAESVANT